MPSEWQILATSVDQVRSIVELRADGCVWVRASLSDADAQHALRELARTVHTLQHLLKTSQD